MRIKNLIVILIALTMILPNNIIGSTAKTEKSRGSTLTLDFNWVPNRYLSLFNNTTYNIALRIDYNGPTFKVDIDITWPSNIYANFSNLRNLSITHGSTFLNISIRGVLDSDRIFDSYHAIAKITNSTYEIEDSIDLDISIYLPISGRFGAPFDINSINESFPIGSIQGLAARGKPISIDVSITNLFDFQSINQYFGLQVTFTSSLNSRIFKTISVFNFTKITIKTNEMKYLRFDIPFPEDQDIDQVTVELVTSSDSSFKEISNVYYIRSINNSILNTMIMKGSLRIVSGINIMLDLPSSQIISYEGRVLVDYNKMTHFDVEIDNYNDKNYNNVGIKFIDEVSLSASFTNNTYGARKEYRVDVKSFNKSYLHIDYRPKISGLHKFYCVMDTPTRINSNILDIFFKTGLKLAYDNSSEKYQYNQDQKRIDYDYQTVGNDETFQIKIPKNLSAEDFDYSIIPSDDLGVITGNGIDRTGYTYNGNDHLFRDDFVRKLSIIFQRNDNYTLISLKVHYNHVGYFVIIPFIHIDGMVYIFDVNWENKSYLQCPNCQVIPMEIQSATLKVIKVEPRDTNSRLIVFSGILGVVALIIMYYFEVFINRKSILHQHIKKRSKIRSATSIEAILYPSIGLHPKKRTLKIMNEQKANKKGRPQSPEDPNRNSRR